MKQGTTALVTRTLNPEVDDNSAIVVVKEVRKHVVYHRHCLQYVSYQSSDEPNLLVPKHRLDNFMLIVKDLGKHLNFLQMHVCICVQPFKSLATFFLFHSATCISPTPMHLLSRVSPFTPPYSTKLLNQHLFLPPVTFLLCSSSSSIVGWSLV